mgnify:CR=1 FL=1
MKDQTINIQYFKKINSYNKAYLLGFIAADGAIVQNKNTNTKTLTITIHTKDVAVLKLLKLELNSSLSIKDINYKSKSLSSYKLDVNHKRFNTSKKEIIQDLESYGLTSNKSLTMTNLIVNIPTQYRKAFILGYFDGDGCFIDSKVVRKRKYLKKDGSFSEYTGEKYNSHISIKGTKEFLQGIVDELQIQSYRIKQIQNQNIFTLLIVKNSDILKFYDCYNHCDFYLQRKKDKFTRKILQVRTISSPSA